MDCYTIKMESGKYAIAINDVNDAKETNYSPASFAIIASR